jgi:hypothetical protein
MGGKRWYLSVPEALDEGQKLMHKQKCTRSILNIVSLEGRKSTLGRQKHMLHVTNQTLYF